ncbi:hypothetical protein, partial [Yersinia aleksiciae]|uniref:hypothetical protein n=1 Tax=Yersinia aleksiciae TaxID=263819 RepID=UPI001C9508C4
LTSQRDSQSIAQARFSRASCPLTLPSLLVGNIPDCAQEQKKKSKSRSFVLNWFLKLKVHLSC